MLHGFTAQKNVYSNHIAAYVEDRVITTQQIEREAANLKISPPKALNMLSEKIIIAKEFDRMNGQLPENCVQKKYDEVQKTRFSGDHLNFEEALREGGKTKRSFKDELRENTIVEFMYERNVTVPSMASPWGIQNYYNAHESEMKQERRVSLDQITVNKKSGIP
jgi:hypothetical protein